MFLKKKRIFLFNLEKIHRRISIYTFPVNPSASSFYDKEKFLLKIAFIRVDSSLASWFGEFSPERTGLCPGF
jgi:hypothetical protein